ncbi:MAG: hypothetical protein WD850_03030 [Candidatus Spechtbacterales bacterium]
MDTTTIALLAAVLLVAVGGYWYFFMRTKGGANDAPTMTSADEGVGMEDSTNASGGSMGMGESVAPTMTPDTPEVPAEPSYPSEPPAPSIPTPESPEMPGMDEAGPSTGSGQREEEEPRTGGTV